MMTMFQERLLIKILCSALVVLLRFDGSLRPPRDPGFPTLPSRLATCASCLSTATTIAATIAAATEHHRSNDCGGSTPLAVGSRLLPISFDSTSAHTEYEGLLLGLDYLLSKEGKDAVLARSKDPDNHNLLIIQGDCKTVIDQLSGRALPRKLRPLHQKVMEKIAKLQPQTDKNKNKKKKNSSIMFDEIRYQHIPRSQNLVCDNICSNLMIAIANAAYQNCWLELDHVLRLDDENNNDNKTSLRSSAVLSDIWARYLGGTSSSSSSSSSSSAGSSSIIKYSIRPPLYLKFANLARATNDFSMLVGIGESLASESKYHATKSASSAYFQRLGICFQIEAWRGLGQEKKAMALERKHRVILSRKPTKTPPPTTKPTMMMIEGAEEEVPAWNASICQEWTPLLKQWWISTSEKTTSSWQQSSATLWVPNTILEF